MNKKILVLCISVVIVCVIGLLLVILNSDDGYIPQLKVVGDVEKCIDVSDESIDYKEYTIKHNEKSYTAIKLEDILSNSNVYDESYDVLLVSYDGRFSRINSSQISNSYISFDNEYGYSSINLYHPPSANIKLLKEIVVISKNKSLEHDFNIITSDKNLLSISVGNFIAGETKQITFTDGKATKNVNGTKYNVEVFKKRRCIKADDLIDIDYEKRNIVMGEQGDYQLLEKEDFLEIKDNYVNLLSQNGKVKVKKAKGIYINAVLKSNMDVYYDALHYIENGEKVMFIFLDGFSYKQYKYCKENGVIPFIEKQRVQIASSIYKPVTNAGFAAMITGKSPQVNGVYSRKQKDLKVPSIFGKLIEMNKKAVLIEGNIKILNTEIEPMLNLDKNNNNTTDDEIFITAKSMIKEDNDFVLVHFHGIDDKGHSFGDLADETIEDIRLHDEYVKQLVENFDGKVIITADHGMHSTESGGTHGDFRYEDLIVPYMIID
ncbi:alkaline phosphatase family protein [Clostridiaceae bacterium M8S5]|nr:alkaline phosphatase family protein [Clostridiaceae bacterium M8S5]